MSPKCFTPTFIEQQEILLRKYLILDFGLVDEKDAVTLHSFLPFPAFFCTCVSFI